MTKKQIGSEPIYDARALGTPRMLVLGLHRRAVALRHAVQILPCGHAAKGLGAGVWGDGVERIL